MASHSAVAWLHINLVYNVIFNILWNPNSTDHYTANKNIIQCHVENMEVAELHVYRLQTAIILNCLHLKIHRMSS